MAASAFASTPIGLVDFDGGGFGLTNYTNDQIVGDSTTNGQLISGETYSSFDPPGDAFNPMSRVSLSPSLALGGQFGLPFGISDD